MYMHDIFIRPLATKLVIYNFTSNLPLIRIELKRFFFYKLTKKKKINKEPEFAEARQLTKCINMWRAHSPTYHIWLEPLDKTKSKDIK